MRSPTSTRRFDNQSGSSTGLRQGRRTLIRRRVIDWSTARKKDLDPEDETKDDSGTEAAAATGTSTKTVTRDVADLARWSARR